MIFLIQVEHILSVTIMVTFVKFYQRINLHINVALAVSFFFFIILLFTNFFFLFTA